MSTTTTNRAVDYAPAGGHLAQPQAAGAPVGGPLPLRSESGASSLLWGLPIVVWIKIGIVAALMVALFRFNLARLWGKTNPFTGQSDNWQHSMLLPLIGLYYLYVWRDELLGNTPAAAQAVAKPSQKVDPWTLMNLWGLTVGMGAAAVGVACATAPDVLLASVTTVAGLPVPLALAVMVAWTVGSGTFIWARRHTLGGPFLDRALDGVSQLLRTWLLLAPVAWGMGFFVWVGSASTFALVRLALGALSIGGLAAVVALRGSDRVRSISRQLNATSAGWFGGFVMLFGILFSFWGIWPGQNDFFKDIGMVVALFGVTTLLAGWRVMRVAWFPIAFLLCAIPWPDQYYSRLALPLQYLAAKVAVHVLNMTGVMASQQGTKMVMSGFGGTIRTLNVAEACAGLRSLMTFISVAGAIAFLSARPLWQKVVVVASAVPIAITCNVMRVSGQGLLDHYVSQQWSQGFAHGFAGLVMLIPGFFLILLVIWILDHLFIDVVEDDENRLKQANARRATAVAMSGAPRGVRSAGADVAAAAPVARAPANPAPTPNAPAAQVVPAPMAPARAAAAAAQPRPASAAPARGDKPAVIQIPRKPAVAGSPPAAPSSPQQQRAAPAAPKPALAAAPAARAGAPARPAGAPATAAVAPQQPARPPTAPGKPPAMTATAPPASPPRQAAAQSKPKPAAGSQAAAASQPHAKPAATAPVSEERP